MTALGPAQVEALRQLDERFRDDRFVVIGATALGFAVEMEWRRTDDLDVTVALGLEAFASNTLGIAGWRRDTVQEQRWWTPDGLKVDVLPAGPAQLAAGEVVWPLSRHRMSLAGFRHLFTEARSLEVAPGLRVPVAPPHLVALLKMVAYLDRPSERERDLGDLAHLFEGLLPAWSDERVAHHQAFLEHGVSFEEAGAWLVGRRLRPLLSPPEVQAVGRFVAKATDPGDPSGTGPRMRRIAPPRWRTEDGEVERQLGALLRGLR